MPGRRGIGTGVVDIFPGVEDTLPAELGVSAPSGVTVEEVDACRLFPPFFLPAFAGGGVATGDTAFGGPMAARKFGGNGTGDCFTGRGTGDCLGSFDGRGTGDCLKCAWMVLVTKQNK